MLGKHIATIDKKVDDSNTIINNLLFYSRIKRPHYEKVNLASVLRECIHAARKRCPGHTVALTRKFGPLGRTPLDADPLQLKELFGNILNNSFDALHDCKGSITIEAARDSHDRVSVRISDDGIGISADDLRRVTEPFFSTKSKGTGLGLTVCKQIVDIHRGTLRIESEPGGGTRVTVTLPLRAPREGTE
jgi:signal transduction histidine kinase